MMSLAQTHQPNFFGSRWKSRKKVKKTTTLPSNKYCYTTANNNTTINNNNSTHANGIMSSKDIVPVHTRSTLSAKEISSRRLKEMTELEWRSRRYHMQKKYSFNNNNNSSYNEGGSNNGRNCNHNLNYSHSHDNNTMDTDDWWYDSMEKGETIVMKSNHCLSSTFQQRLRNRQIDLGTIMAWGLMFIVMMVVYQEYVEIFVPAPEEEIVPALTNYHQQQQRILFRGNLGSSFENESKGVESTTTVSLSPIEVMRNENTNNHNDWSNIIVATENNNNNNNNNNNVQQIVATETTNGKVQQATDSSSPQTASDSTSINNPSSLLLFMDLVKQFFKMMPLSTTTSKTNPIFPSTDQLRMKITRGATTPTMGWSKASNDMNPIKKLYGVDPKVVQFYFETGSLAHALHNNMTNVTESNNNTHDNVTTNINVEKVQEEKEEDEDDDDEGSEDEIEESSTTR